MAKENETIAEIIAEKRRRADEIERDCAEKMKRGEMVSDCYARELVADIRREANRLDQARMRMEILRAKAAGNSAAMREALKATLDLFWDIHNANRSPQSNQAYAVIRKIKAALAATEEEGGAE